MLSSIIASGLAIGAVYALIGITYNTMFSASRVMSFTAGQLGMLGGVLGSLFILHLGLPSVIGFIVTLAACAVVGVVTEIIAVRPVLSKLDQHLYVLSTLALALMTFVFTHVEGIRHNGPVKYFKSWIPDVPKAMYPLIVPLEILGQFMRLISLSVRLYANMLAGHMLILTFIGLIFVLGNLAIADGSALLFVGLPGLAAWLVWLLATGVRLVRS